MTIQNALTDWSVPYAHNKNKAASAAGQVAEAFPLSRHLQAFFATLSVEERSVFAIAALGATLTRLTQREALQVAVELPNAKVHAFGFKIGARTQFTELLQATTRELSRLREWNEPSSLRSEVGLQLASDGSLRVLFDAQALPKESVALFLQQLASFAEALWSRPNTAVLEVPLLSQEQRVELLQRWNATAQGIDEAVLPEQFARQAARTPDAVALAFEQVELTYRELEVRVAALASRLRAHGAGPEVLVGIHYERSLELVVAVLAIHRAGAAYVPLDPHFPRDRLAFMIEDTGMRVIVSDPRLRQELPSSSAALIEVDLHGGLQVATAESIPPAAAPSSLAYVLFTSGSTGKPKGVLVEHRNVANLLAAMDRVLEPSEPGVWLSVTSLNFDISVVELLWSLCRGFKVVLYREPARDGGVRANDESLGALVRRHQVTHLQCTPTMVSMFLADPEARAEISRLKEILLGGEAFSIALARQLRRYSNATLRNLYGPTETTVYSVGCVVDPDAELVPIGRPLLNTQVYILDPERQPVPVGVAGELFIGGRGVTRGYLNRPELNQERFVPDEFSGVHGAWLYRTGDLARYRADGTIDFLGRLDHQVKLRGYRLELGEIENVLAQHASVRDAAVIVREDVPGNQRLVGYVVTAHGTEPTAAELKAFLKTKLPAYMIPATIAFLSELPLTTSKKIDRMALLALEPPKPQRAAARPAAASAS